MNRMGFFHRNFTDKKAGCGECAKYTAAICASFLLALALVSVVPTRAECRIYDDVLRFHVLAESDSEADQELKLNVRDCVLEYVSDRLEKCGSIAEAVSEVGGMLADIEEAAQNCVKENGYDYVVNAEIVSESYPRRDYGAAVIPAGEYKSLKITIGSGVGHNWWCVLFPSICTGFASFDESVGGEYAAAGLTPEEYRIITGGDSYKVKFRILEILESIIGKIR